MTKEINGRLLRHIPLLGGEYILRMWKAEAGKDVSYELNHGNEPLFSGNYQPRESHPGSDLSVAAILATLTELPLQFGYSCLSRYSERHRRFLQGDAHHIAILTREVLTGQRAFPDVELAIREAENIDVFEVTLEYLTDFPEETWFRNQQGNGRLGWYFWSGRWAGTGDSSPRGPYATRGTAYREAYDHFQLGGDRK